MKISDELFKAIASDRQLPLQSTVINKRCDFFSPSRNLHFLLTVPDRIQFKMSVMGGSSVLLRGDFFSLSNKFQHGNVARHFLNKVLFLDSSHLESFFQETRSS